MKVIKQGSLPEDAPKRATCRHCKSVIEYTDREAKYVGPDGPNGPAVYTFDCPVCGYAVYVS